jgi:hypothetical protein
MWPGLLSTPGKPARAPIEHPFTQRITVQTAGCRAAMLRGTKAGVAHAIVM